MIADPVAKALAHAEIDIGAAIVMIEAQGNGDCCYGLRQTMDLIKTARAAVDTSTHLISAAPDLLAAAEMLEDAEDKRQHCEECEGEGEPEACGTCFPFFDDARIARRNAIEKARGRARKD